MKTGKYITKQKDLLEFVSPDEQEITKIFIDLKKGAPVDFEKMSLKLFEWSKKWINKLN